MDINIEKADGVQTVRLSGEALPRDCEQLAEQLQPLVSSPQSRLAIELSGLTQINSACLSELINVVTRARLSQSHVVLAAPSAFVRGVFEMTRLDQWFDVRDTVEQAVEALKASRH